MAILGYCSAIYTGYGASDAIYGIFYAEISNFPMHLRSIILILGKKYTKLYELNEGAYMGLYIISRGIFTPVFLVYPCVLSEKTPFILKFICCGIFL